MEVPPVDLGLRGASHSDSFDQPWNPWRRVAGTSNFDDQPRRWVPSSQAAIAPIDAPTAVTTPASAQSSGPDIRYSAAGWRAGARASAGRASGRRGGGFGCGSCSVAIAMVAGTPALGVDVPGWV